MSPGGPVEEAGATARGIVDALRTQPVVLSLVLFNLVFLAVFYMATRDQRQRQDKFQEQLFQQQSETMKLLYSCVPGPAGNLPTP